MKTTIKRPLLALAIATTVFVSCQTNTTKDDDSKEVAEDQNEEKFETKASEKDAQLVVDLVDGNYQEIRMASYAADHSTNAEVKKHCIKPGYRSYQPAQLIEAACEHKKYIGSK
jgi:putative membrane protein